MLTEQEIADAKVKADADAAEAKVKADAEAAKGGDEETVTIKKSEFEKIQSDRDNYRTAALKKKADERSLDDKGGKDDGDDEDEENVIDEKKVSDLATASARKVQREASERIAKRSFLVAHPEYVDDGEWTGLLAQLTFKGDELTVDDVQDRMEAALFEHKRKTGKLEEHLKVERERSVQEGRIRGNIEFGYQAGGQGDRNNAGDDGKMSAKALEMSQRMHVDPEKFKKVDIKKDNVIQM
jgi:hypothetical protein